jgi:hypothetical protein
MLALLATVLLLMTRQYKVLVSFVMRPARVFSSWFVLRAETVAHHWSKLL